MWVFTISHLPLSYPSHRFFLSVFSCGKSLLPVFRLFSDSFSIRSCSLGVPVGGGKFCIFLISHLDHSSLIKLSSIYVFLSFMGFFGGSEVKASACNAGYLGSIPGSERSPGEGNGNPLQHSCLENPMDGGAWWATVHGVAKSQTRLSNFSSLHFTSSFMWRRQWHPTPVLLPGKSHGRRSLVGCSPWGCEESDTTEQLHFHFPL